MKAGRLGIIVATIAIMTGVLSAQDAPHTAARSDATPAAAADLPSSTTAAASPLAHVRVTEFPIPFNIDQGDPQTLDVLLYVSVDQGAKWIPYARQRAAAGQFIFRAGGDGEYWFASQTLLAGSPAPANPAISPQLRVNVDTRAPRVALNAQIDANGRITAAWDAFDEFLAPETLKLECQGGPGQAWETVSVQRPAGDASRTNERGQTSWLPRSLDKLVTVRIEIRDKAGNIGSINRRLIVPLSLVFRRTPVSSVAASNIPPDPLGNHGPSPSADQQPSPDASAAHTAPQAGSTGMTPTAGGATGGTGVEVENAASEPIAQSNGNGQNDSVGEPSSPHAVARAQTPQPDSVRWPSGQETRVGEDPQASAYPPARSPAGPPVADAARGELNVDPVSAGGAVADHWPDGSGLASLPAGERPRMTKLRRFNLDYSVDAVGPGGVKKVELWVTRNGGRDWNLWGEDEDCETPILVDMEDESEGIYGFRVVVVGNNGLASQTPQPGELADLWIGIDSTAPDAQIVSAEYGRGSQAGHLIIRWRADDAYLAPRPITIKFSPEPGGEWTTIAAGLPNTGEYAWQVGPRVPDEFYLRLEARDEAGNVAVYDLERPVKSAGLTPRGHIRAVAPIETQARSAFQP